MANFLDDLSSYNAKAALAISNAVAEGNTQRANMMSSLKSTANDTTLSDVVRLNALTALINMGSLLDIPLPPYFPTAATYANTQTYVGIHNDLSGLQGGAAGEYFHLTQAQYNNLANAATLADINFANLGGSYTQNAGLNAAISAKQNALNGTGFVKISGTTISYDNSVYLTSSTGIASGSAAGGELTGTYPNPALSNAAVISKVLTGWNGTATPASVTSSDSILTALQKINANVNQIIASPPGVASVALTNNAGTVFSTTSTPQTGAAILNVSLNTQNKNLFLASSSTTNGLVPSFRAIVAADLPVSGVTAGSYGTATDIPVLTIDNKGRITLASVVSAASGGQVNSVTMTVPSGTVFNAVNSGTATDPVVGFSLQTQTANTVFAGPTTGSAAVPGFRSLVLADIAGITIPQSQIDGLSATLSTFMTNSLANSTMYVGNTSNAAVNAAVAGDLTMAYVDNSGTNEANFTIANGAVTYAKMQNVTAQTVLGRYALTNGVAQELTFDASDFTINSSTGVIGLVTPNPPTLTTKGDLLTSNGTAQVRLGIGANATLFMADSAAATGNKWVAMSGDVTIATSGATTIANSAVTLAKIANIADETVLGNISGSSAAPAALTKAQLTSLVNQFTSTLSGIVPASGGGTTNFLRADGNWVAVTGTGTVTDVSVATANGFTGSVATSTTTPDISIALDGITGVLAGAGSTIQAAASGVDYVEPGAITATSGAGSGLQMTGSALLGRTGAGLGAIQQISVNSTLSLASTTLGINLGNANTWTAQQQFPSIRLNGSTSGFVVIQPPAIAGSQTYTLPTATPGGAGEFLTATTGGVLSWATPQGSGTTTNAVTFNNSGSGAASGTTFDGSVARTISYNTIGAQALNANLTGLSSLTYVSGTPFVKMTAAGTFALDNNTYISGTTTQYGVVVGGAGNSVASITPNSADKLLISNGTGANPSWTDATYPSTTSINRILYSSANNVIDEIAAPTVADTFLKWDGSSFTWAAGGGGGGGGTVTNVSVSPANGFSGTVINPTTTPAITLSTSITGILKGSAGALTAAIPSVDYAPATSGTSILKGNGSGGFANATAGTDYLTSITLTMPSAFTVTPGTLTANGTFAVTGAGTVSQYIRGDGTLGIFPSIGGGGGGSVYYLNGGVTASPSSIGGVAMKQLSKAPITAGASVNFTGNADGATIASFLTDAGDPNQTSIPAGIWVFECYLSAAGGGSAHPTVQAVVETWDGTTLSVIATGVAEEITNGATKDLYQFAVTIPTGTTISLTDRVVVQIKVVTAASKTITLYTQNGNVSSVTTTFPNGIASLNGLTAATQLFANGTSGTAPAFVSSTATHTLNIPLASTASVTAGLISNTDYTTFSNKISNPMTTLGDIIYGGASGTPTRLGIGSTNQVLSVVGGIPAWTSAGSGDVTGPSSSTDGNFAVFNSTTGKIIMESAAASLGSGAGGRATFNNGVDVGVSSSTTGTLVFRNSSNVGRTIIQASTSQAASDINYYWPIAQGTAGQILATDASGNLSWTAAGAGNMILASVQTNTGAKTFNSGTLILAGSTSGTTIFNAAATAGSTTITLPALTGTVALLDNAQTFTGAKTFSTATTTFNLAAATGSAISITGAGSTTTAQVAFSGSTMNWINFGTNGLAIPAVATRSAGTKIVIYPNIGASTTDNAIGADGGGAGGNLWISSPNSVGFYPDSSTAIAGAFRYLSTVRGLNLTATGAATIPQMLINGSTYQWISFGAGAVGDPALTSGTRSAGTKIVLYSHTTLDNGFGVDGSSTGGNLWITTPNAIKFYTNGSTTVRATIDSSAFTLADAVNIAVNATTGTKIGTATSQKIAFWNKTPIVQPTTAITGAARVGGAGTTVTTTDTYGGYTIAQIAAALVNTGILA
jgi:hypothetical protein